jgi:hypothetical protein
MDQSLIPFLSPSKVLQEIGELPSILMSAEESRQRIPHFYAEASGMTPEEKQLDLVAGRIQTLVATIEAHKLEIGFLIFFGNYTELYKRAGGHTRSMEDYLKNVRHVSPSLVEESNKMFKAYVQVAPYVTEKEKIRSATSTQIDAIQKRVDDVKKQHTKSLDERAQKQEEAKDFRSLPPDKKEEIAKEAERDYTRAITEEVNYILNAPSEEAHKIVAASSSGKPDRPLILIKNVHLEVISRDPSIVELSFTGRCELNEQQISSMKRENVTWKFETEDNQLLSLKELGYWVDDAL